MLSSRFVVRRDFADTLVARPGGSSIADDALARLAREDRADWILWGLVLCTAAATLLLAVACSLAA
jgi:hypothetical protein